MCIYRGFFRSRRRLEGKHGMKLYAIKENHLYAKAYKNGKKAVAAHICVYILTDYHAARLQKENPMKKRINRVGLTATKKLGGAVTRNRVKRIMREALYRAQKTHHIKTGCLIVIAAREAAVGAKTNDIYKDLMYALKKLGMILP